jgi:NTP pyrophosphatase (non-canonical NTP hydrolase)
MNKDPNDKAITLAAENFQLQRKLSCLQTLHSTQWHELGRLTGENAELKLKNSKLEPQNPAEISMLTYLNHCLAEECGEVVQVLGKIGRFGLNDTAPNDTVVNFDKLTNEIHDVVAVYEMFCTHEGKSSFFDRNQLDAKKIRVMKYLDYSKKKGILPYE